VHIRYTSLQGCSEGQGGRASGACSGSRVQEVEKWAVE
jgi:hypothetical protein